MARELPEKMFSDRDKPSPRRASWFKRLIVLVLLVVVGWFAWYSYRRGSIPNIANETQRKLLIEQLRRDLRLAEEKAVSAGKQAMKTGSQVVNWASKGIDELRGKIQGKPPETKEEVSTLVQESKQDVVASKPVTDPNAPDDPRDREEKQKGSFNAEGASIYKKYPWTPDIQVAWEQYYQGVARHAKSDPSLPNAQAALREAEPYFVACMNTLEQIKEKMHASDLPVKELEKERLPIEALEQKAAQRLYDCRKRMTAQ